MLNFFKLSMLSACLVNTLVFASGHPDHQEAEEKTFISAPLQLSDKYGIYQDPSFEIYLIDDASTHEEDAWFGDYVSKDIVPSRIHFRDPEAKILQGTWQVPNMIQPADWVNGSYIAIVYQAYGSDDPSDKSPPHDGIYPLHKTLELTYQGKLGVNLDEWYPVNEPGRVGWAKRIPNEFKALANLRLFIRPPTKG